ncbi:MAG: lytic transglycosylase domain-containing protein [Clostridia bacterium]
MKNRENKKKIKIKKDNIKIISKILIAILLIIIAYASSIVILKYLVYPAKHIDIIKKEAEKNNLDPYLVLAIIKTESGFNTNAVSKKHAKGLMQIMDSTANDMNEKSDIIKKVDGNNIYDIDINIALGCKYFSSLVEKYKGNYYLAICAYNAGMGNIDKWLNKGIVNMDLAKHKNISLPFNETEKYLYKVILAYKMYSFLY